MITTLKICGFCVLSSLLLAGQPAQGQVFQTSAHTQARADRSTPAMKYFGRGIRTPVVQRQMHRQAPPTQQFQAVGAKPFQNVNRRPTISPYLGLDTIESSVGLPNYYSRVLPQIQQQEANDAQAAKLHRLQRQTRLANVPGAISGNRNRGVITTGYSAQFMNVGGYFPTLRR